MTGVKAPTEAPLDETRLSAPWVARKCRYQCCKLPATMNAGGRPWVRDLAEPWNGVSLGGWLLLEPGPSNPLFEESAQGGSASRMHCEWDLCTHLRKRGCAEEVLRKHRERHVTKADFEAIKACGLNAVRLPFGYWVVLGPCKDEPYVGPAIEFVDRAVQWAEECGLQIVLDLHGCPGGESGDAPCGHRQRPEGTWHWRNWRMRQSLEALEVVARRYAGRACVTGIEVCNEPSNTVPVRSLCRYYAKAVQTIRAAGMTKVVVVLPIFQRCEFQVVKVFYKMTGGKLDRICFDQHLYHCFDDFHGKTLAQQLRATAENAEMLRHYPMVVGEWSLALGQATWMTRGDMSQEEVYRLFGASQLASFREASHGHFFWNWHDRKETAMEWNYQEVLRKGLLPGPLPRLPAWEGPLSGREDPMEEQLNPSPPEPRVFYGEKAYLRAFHGGYVDVLGSCVAAQYCDKGRWQEITFCPPVSRARVSGQVRASRSGVRKGHGKREAQKQREVRHGDVVSLRGFNGRYLALSRGSLRAVSHGARPSAKFVVHIETARNLENEGSAEEAEELPLKHRATLFLQCKASGKMVNANTTKGGMFAHWRSFGDWQRLAVEKEFTFRPEPMQLDDAYPGAMLRETSTCSSGSSGWGSAMQLDGLFDRSVSSSSGSMSREVSSFESSSSSGCCSAPATPLQLPAVPECCSVI